MNLAAKVRSQRRVRRAKNIRHEVRMRWFEYQDAGRQAKAVRVIARAERIIHRAREAARERTLQP